jgi:hypothetical protein
MKLKAKRGCSEITTPPSSPLTSTSSPLSEPPDEGDLKEIDVDGLMLERGVQNDNENGEC